MQLPSSGRVRQVESNGTEMEEEGQKQDGDTLRDDGLYSRRLEQHSSAPRYEIESHEPFGLDISDIMKGQLRENRNELQR